MPPIQPLAALLIAVVLSDAATGVGQGVPGMAPASDGDARLAQLEQEIAALRCRVEAQSGCQPCAGGCPPCQNECQYGGLVFGAALVFAKPHYKESFEAATVSGLTGQMNLLGFNYDYDATPRIWLGYSGSSGAGLRASYWQYDHSAAPKTLVADPLNLATAQAMTVIFPATVTAAVPGDVLSVGSGLELQTVDLEGTQALEVGHFTVLFGAGLRYATMNQESTAAVTSGGSLTQLLHWSRRFNGLGPTASLDVRRPLGDWGLEIVGSARGALLFGNKDLDRQVTPPALPNPPLVSLTNADEVLGLGAVELGAQWTQPFRGGHFFLRGAYEGQLWAEAGAPTLTFLGFEGFSFTAGISR